MNSAKGEACLALDTAGTSEYDTVSKDSGCKEEGWRIGRARKEEDSLYSKPW